MDESAQRFLQFYYPEAKDLCKHFLTLISATLVFTVTFSEKIIDFQKAPIALRIVLFLSLFLMIVALGLCGAGLRQFFMAMEQASGAVGIDYGIDFSTLSAKGSVFVELSGITYGVALVTLVAIAATRLLL